MSSNTSSRAPDGLDADQLCIDRPIELSADVESVAGEMAVVHRLRGADAVHLASALALGSAEVIVAVWGERLRAGAAAVGLRVAPATLD